MVTVPVDFLHCPRAVLQVSPATQVQVAPEGQVPVAAAQLLFAVQAIGEVVEVEVLVAEIMQVAAPEQTEFSVVQEVVGLLAQKYLVDWSV